MRTADASSPCRPARLVGGGAAEDAGDLHGVPGPALAGRVALLVEPAGDGAEREALGLQRGDRARQVVIGDIGPGPGHRAGATGRAGVGPALQAMGAGAV